MNSRSKIKNKLFIFDLDGTLYTFHGGSFKKSSLKRAVWAKALKFIANRLAANNAESKKIFKKIRLMYGENISIGLEKEYGISRFDYFEYTWKLPAKEFINKNSAVKGIITRLSKNNKVIVLSDAPKVWINSVLKELGLYSLLKNNIRSGEGDTRKIFGNAFEAIVKEFDFDASDCAVIGDQEETDIIPAKKIGLKTIFVGKKTSKFADSTINDISEVESAVENIF